jgi:penicillin-binding protein 1C
MAVARSLNVPFVKMLQQYGLEKFHFNLKRMGISSLHKPPAHYGLTLVLGGAESTLWDLTGSYRSMAKCLRDFYPNNGYYARETFQSPGYFHPPEYDQGLKPEKLVREAPFLSAGTIWLTLEAMEELERPPSEGDWERFESSRPIAWKTGTSFGFRDAWAIGITPDYVVGVWIGNADGEGRPGLIGVYTAAPVMFDIFGQLPVSRWFDQPFDAMKKMIVCKKSGYLALDLCEKDTIWGTENSINLMPCPYHQWIHTDKSKRWQLTDRCAHPSDMLKTPWFVLPPLEEYYYKTKNPNYLPLPPYKMGCDDRTADDIKPMQIIYPKKAARIFVPLDLDGQPSRTVFKMAHRNPGATVFWHLDRSYLGSTTSFHELALNPPPGKHTLTVVDDKGNRLEQTFEVLIKSGQKK